MQDESKKNWKETFSSRNIKVDILAILFGLGAWIGVTSVYLQLPLIVPYAPEGWSLPSYMVVIVQAAIISPISYTLFQKYSSRKIKEEYLIYILYLMGAIAAVLFAFFHQYTAYVAGEYRSVVLLTLMFCFALIGCTSSVLFMPYMGRFRDIYLTTYLVGEGCNGLVTSIVALIQGVSGNPECLPNNSTDEPPFIKYVSPPRFETRDFFLFVFVMYVVSAIAFFLLSTLKMCKKEYCDVKITYGNDYEYQNNFGTVDEMDNGNDQLKILSSSNNLYLFILMATICVLGNGIFPALQSYSCLPYSYLTYHLTVTLTSIANPVACFMAVFLKHKSIRNITILASSSAIISSFVLATALIRPAPPLSGTAGGEALVVICWTILFGLISYTKLSITSVMRDQGGKSLVRIGIVSQVGSTIGAVIVFLLVSQTSIFVSQEQC